MLGFDVGVAFGRRDPLVAKHLLDRSQIGPTREQMGREAVPQHVRRHRARDAGASPILLELGLDVASGHSEGLLHGGAFFPMAGVLPARALLKSGRIPWAMDNENMPQDKSEILIYQAEDGKSLIQVRLAHDTV